MKEQTERAETIDASSLLKKYNRRAFLRLGAEATIAGATLGIASRVGLVKLTSSIEDIVFSAEKEVRRLNLAYEALSGSIGKDIEIESKKIEEAYVHGKLDIYERAGIATPQDLKELEELIKVNRNLENHYTLAERAKEFKDRLDERLLSYDKKLEDMQPGALRKFNDFIRESLGKKSGKEGEEYRGAVKQRLEGLVKIYDTNRDTRVASKEVLRKINEYIEKTPNMSKEENELLTFLREKYSDEKTDKESLKQFIINYNNYDGSRVDLALKLRASIAKAEEVYRGIDENKKYLQRLQGMLKEGIDIKEDARKKSVEEAEAYRKQYEAQLGRLKSKVDTIITELKEKGYDIETTEEYVNKGSFTDKIRSILRPIKNIGPFVIGGAGALATAYSRRKTLKRKAVDGSYKEAVSRHNQLANQYNHLASEKDNLSQEYEGLSARNNSLYSRNTILTSENQDLADRASGLQIELEKYKSTEPPLYIDGGGI